ncbi:MAG TPA: hypothetical protein VK524_16160 [Polyangiaceae bacterium]|nr:hypothetical protein [Polyangiaceae bacterium]
MLVFGTEQHSLRLVGALALRVEGAERTHRDRELLSRVASQLLEHGDIEGIILEDVATK